MKIKQNNPYTSPSLVVSLISTRMCLAASYRVGDMNDGGNLFSGSEYDLNFGFGDSSDGGELL